MEVATGALPSLILKLGKLLMDEYSLQKEVKGGIRFLQTELETMKAALDEISNTPADKISEVDKIWAREVKELSYDIEDKIDTFIVRCMSSKLAEQHGIKKIISRSHNWLTQPKIRRTISTDIREIKSRVEDVSKRRDRYKVNAEVAKPILIDPRLFARYEKTTELVGINEARDELVKMMMEGNGVSKQYEKILSIVGFGGLGKTTLANVVYQNLRAQFDCSAFVSVSQTPDMDKLFNNLLYQLGKRDIAGFEVIDELREFLGKKRYLIVIDDIWKTSVWKTIRYALPDNNHGCRIITTTRILKVAEEVGGVYKMKPLSLHSSRILLYRRIFGNKDEEKCPNEELAEVSNRILSKCAGVPLAIITIASLLASKGTDKLDWYEVYNSIGRGMEDSLDVVNMRNILSFSYYNLPSHLRTCLLYLSVFPEDYEIEKRSLIWMWISEGFVHCGKHGQNTFEVGESYFNELVNASMIQAVYDWTGMNVLSCRVHDMVLDLIHSISSEENFITMLNDVGHMSPSQKVRRLCLQSYNEDHGTLGATVSMQQARSVVLFSSAVNLIPALSRFKVVRLLHLENCDLSHSYNLKYIGKLVHLRFLGLRSTKIDHLPEEIGNLQFLEVLDISRNYRLSTLPFNTVQLRQLKCLYIDGTTTKGLRGLTTSLEELSIYINESLDIEALGHLTELRVLDIGGSCYLTLAKFIGKLQKIQNLSIYFEGRVDSCDWVGPQSLRSLQVDGCWFPKLPVLINVQNLSFLRIMVKQIQHEDMETLGRLHALRDLHMWLGEGRSSISREFVFSDAWFPSLVHCKLLGYYYERLVFQQGAMPKLRSLELDISIVVWSSWTSTPDMGFENLPSLLDLRVGLCGCLRKARKAWAALLNMAANHPNRPNVSAAGLRRTDGR